MQLQRSPYGLSLRPDFLCLLIIPLVSFLCCIKQKLLVFTCVACNDLFPPLFALIISRGISAHPSRLQVFMFSLQALTFPFCALFVLSSEASQTLKLPPDPLSNSFLTFSLARLSKGCLSTVKHLECWDHNFLCWPVLSDSFSVFPIRAQLLLLVIGCKLLQLGPYFYSVLVWYPAW